MRSAIIVTLGGAIWNYSTYTMMNVSSLAKQLSEESPSQKTVIIFGGSAVAGENSRQAASRELYEELGISHDFLHDRPMLTVHFERGFDDVYVIHKDIAVSELKLQLEEVQAAKWADRDEIYSLIDSGTFIPYYKSFIDMLFNYRTNRGNIVKE